MNVPEARAGKLAGAGKLAEASKSAGAGRLAGAALRCYPARWRRRHGDEAVELAALLIADGTPAASIAWNYLLGAAREWLTPRPGRFLSTVTAGLLAAVCLLGLSAALVAGSGPARAAGTAQSPSGARSPSGSVSESVASGGGSWHRVASCRPVLPRDVTGAIPAAGHWRLSVRGAERVRSC